MGLLINGQVGWRSATVINPSQASSLWTSVYAVYNADAVGSSSLNTSLYAAYNGESNANDSFGTNNGTAQGGLTYGVGKIGNAFTFNGSNAYVGLPNNSLNLTGDFSISMWVYLTGFPSEQIPISNFYEFSPTAGNSRGWMIYMNGQNLYWIVCGSSQVNLITSISSFQNTWKQITITFKNGVGSKIYFDGNLVTSNSSTITPIYNSTQTPFIGKYQYGNGSSFGYMNANSKVDALNIWNKELTSTEITELYNSGNGAQYITDSFYKPTTSDALNTYNGTAQGGLTYGVGKVGTAFTFNGTNAYVSMANNSFNLTGDFSFSFWIYPTFTSGVDYRIMGTNYYAGGAYGNGWQISRFSTNKVAIQMGSNTFFSQMEGPSTMLPNNTWTHVVVTRKKSTSTKIYINGTDVTSSFPHTLGNSSIDPVYAATQYCQIGANKYDANPASSFMSNGSKMDAVNVWNKELTASEITELYNAGNGKQYPN